MLSFAEADKFLTERSSKEIFYRVVLYIVWKEREGKRYGHDVLATLVAAFCGKFESKVYDDPAIIDLLKCTEYGWNNQWGTELDKWAGRYCKSQTDIYHWQHLFQMINQKSDDIYHLINENGSNGHIFDDYFPNPFNQRSSWPRL